MSKVAFITGTSSGIGKAIAEKLLSEGYYVIGYSRRNTLNHENYEHLESDLSNPEEVKNITFKKNFTKNKNPKQVVLVNNAGTIGPVKHIGNIPANDFISAIHLNLIVPALLINTFCKEFFNSEAQKVIINISSGAAGFPVDGWAAYCTSKAGLEMYAQVVNEDWKQEGHNNCYIYNIAPGIVDTEMQDEIRKKKEEDFSRLSDFKKYKEKGELVRPEGVANKVYKIINHPEKEKKIRIAF